MKKYIYLLVIWLFAVGCSKTSSPIQVAAPVEFGGYEIHPPQGYWYFPRQLSTDFRKKKDYFAVMTLAPNKKDIPYKDKQYAHGENFLLFNFSIAENKYDSFEAYYNAAKQAGVVFNELPREAEILNKIPKWSCKQTETDMMNNIACSSLRGDLLSIYVVGSDKAEVLAVIPQLKTFIESIRTKE